MPPYVPRKHLRTPSPTDSKPVAKKPRSTKEGDAIPVANVPARKSTLFDDLDAGAKNRSAEKTKSAIQQMQDDDDESSSLSPLSDAEFEDVPAPKRQKVSHVSETDEDDSDDIEFEDVPSHDHQPDPMPSGDLELTLYQDKRASLANELGKKGPSKREKAIRIATHCMHVQFLLWHNAIRNSWLCDEEVQAIMISHLPPRLWGEVDRWKRSSGLDSSDRQLQNATKAGTSAREKGKGKQAASRPAKDWSDAADRLERGVPDMSHGDPLLRLMKCLLSWWKQRFRITAPGLRRWGYMDARRLGKLRESFDEGEHDPERHGERIKNIEGFRRHAQDCAGSRDVGSQLFTALLRGLRLEARMVANLQPLGFGWCKAEEAGEDVSKADKPDGGDKSSKSAAKQLNGKSTGTKKARVRPASRRRRKSDRDSLKMELDDSDEYAEPLTEDSDDDSVIDLTEEIRPKQPEAKPYDKDLEFPHYWTEVLSPVTKRWIPVDPIVKTVVASNRDLIESLEPRGGKAEKAKQVMAYCIGFSQDGTAKDVTVRYLKKQIYPGKTKGVRISEEKVPVYNKHGKVKRYDQFGWFRSVMRGYVRGGRKWPITETDEAEDSTDLKPAKPEKKEVKEGEETLQYYKTSKEYVLKRHLKREEALVSGAVPVKVFRNKSKGSKVEEENVYLRKDVVAVKSAETWHKQGRAPLPGVVPLKHAPYRAATTNRRREIAEAEAATGQKVLQPLYSFDQTDWIIPEPIKDGVIPKNEYGNIDMFAEHMCPEGAVHVPYRGVARVCRRLGVDYAEAVVGFEFGHRMAVPVIQGVVVAEENHARVLEELERDEAERARKEDEKRRRAALAMWRKLLMGLRIADRIRQDYGHLDNSVEVFGHAGRDEKEGGFEETTRKGGEEEDMAGGFLPEGDEEEEEDAGAGTRHTSSFFPATHDDEGGDGAHHLFEIRDGSERPDEAEAGFGGAPAAAPSSQTEESTRPVLKNPKKAAAKPKARHKQTSTRRRTRRKRVPDSEEDDDDDDFGLSDSD
ncbi:hypothetical protein DL762_005799 [Monosporascus cannonballus]|uniref:Rad4 beta-hairpin domain-containing protein n=1 Tax=Monosporascus cannonballus TaxID=155416 RepID=A0ABY0H4B8_9PEZI|nr:hypothetical protein DL762_005799 [Monosporascus cannonballus]